MPKGVGVHIYGDYDGTGVKKATQDISYLDKQAKGFSSSITKSFAGLGASLGGIFAATAIVDFFRDSAAAAMEDEKSMVALSKAMDNVGLSAQNAKAEGLIESMMLQTGIADDQLRPAFQKLVTVTKDVGEAQGLLKTALDLSAAGYGNLESATKALSAAANGNFTALQRLKVPIDANIIASKDFDGAIQALNKTVGGQAAAAANTYAGQMSRLTVAAGEAQEAIGYALLNAISNTTKAISGTGGAQQAMLGLGDYIADAIEKAGFLTTTLATVATSFKRAGTDIGLSGKAMELFAGIIQRLLLPGLALAGDAVRNLGIIWNQMPDWMKTAANATLGWSGVTTVAAGSAKVLGAEANRASVEHEHLARAAAGAKPAIAGMANGMDDLADSSANAAEQILKATLATNAMALSREHNARAEMAGKGPSLELLRILIPMREAMDNVSTSTRGAASAGEDLAVKWKAAAESVKADIDVLTLSFGGGGTVIAAGLVDAFEKRLEAFRGIVSTQTGIIKSAQDAIDSYSQSITDSIIGKINFSTTDPTTGVSLTPEQIVQMVLGDIANQQTAVAAISQIATQIPPALTQQIIALPPDAAIALANYLAANPAMMEQLTTSFQALADFTKDKLGDPMGRKWTEIGGESATKLIAEAQKKIDAAAGSFAAFVASKLDTTITVDVEYKYHVGNPPGIPGRAVGGPVSAGAPYIVGERGPELFIPDVSGAIVPNHDLGGGGAGGSTYNITVNAGVGDPRAIGRSVVEAITLYERSSGPVFARA